MLRNQFSHLRYACYRQVSLTASALFLSIWTPLIIGLDGIPLWKCALKQSPSESCLGYPGISFLFQTVRNCAHLLPQVNIHESWRKIPTGSVLKENANGGLLHFVKLRSTGELEKYVCDVNCTTQRLVYRGLTYLKIVG